MKIHTQALPTPMKIPRKMIGRSFTASEARTLLERIG